MKPSIRKIADRYLTANTLRKGFFIDRSTTPSTIYISDGRNVIYLETGGRYKGKFVPIESAKMPHEGLQSLPAGKEHFGLHIDGNIVSEIASVLRDSSYRVVAPSLGKVRHITYSAPFDPKTEWDLLIGQPLSFGEPTGIPEIDRKHFRKANKEIELKDVMGRTRFNRAETKYVTNLLQGVNENIASGHVRNVRWWVNGVTNDFGQFARVESGEWGTDYLDNLEKHYHEHKKNGLRMVVMYEMYQKLKKLI